MRNYLAGSIAINPQPLSVTAASLEVKGQLVKTNVTAAVVRAAISVRGGTV